MTYDNWIPPWLKEGVAPLLAVIIVCFGFATIWYRPECKTEIIAIMMAVIGFYFGSSKGSQEKDTTISNALQSKEEESK